MPVSTKDTNVIFPLNKSFSAKDIDDKKLNLMAHAMGQLIAVAIHKMSRLNNKSDTREEHNFKILLKQFLIQPKKASKFSESTLKDHEHLKWMMASRENFDNTVKLFKSTLAELSLRGLINCTPKRAKETAEAVVEKINQPTMKKKLKACGINTKELISKIEAQNNVHQYALLLKVFETYVAKAPLEKLSLNMQFTGDKDYLSAFPPLLLPKGHKVSIKSKDPLGQNRELFAWTLNKQNEAALVRASLKAEKEAIKAKSGKGSKKAASQSVAAKIVGPTWNSSRDKMPVWLDFTDGRFKCVSPPVIKVKKEEGKEALAKKKVKIEKLPAQMDQEKAEAFAKEAAAERVSEEAAPLVRDAREDETAARSLLSLVSTIDSSGDESTESEYEQEEEENPVMDFESLFQGMGSQIGSVFNSRLSFFGNSGGSGFGASPTKASSLTFK